MGHRACVGGIVDGRGLATSVAIHQSAKAHHALLAPKGYQLDGLALARLETYCGGGGDVKMLAEGLRAVELQKAIDLEEVKVRAYLYRPVARVLDLYGSYGLVGVVLDGLGGQYHSAYGGGLRGGARCFRLFVHNRMRVC